MGWPQESEFYWVSKPSIDKDFWVLIDSEMAKYYRDVKGLKIISTPLASELMEPMGRDTDTRQIFFDCFHGKWLAGYGDEYDDDRPFMDSIPDALAKLAIYLMKEGIIKF